MSAALDLCEQYYGTRDVYKLLKITKFATQKEIKSAYYDLALQVHPDKVTVEEKETANEKFKILTKLYSVLSDSEKRCLYDEKGVIDDEENPQFESSIYTSYRQCFKPMKMGEVTNFTKGYADSSDEHRAIRAAYLEGDGSIKHIISRVPFLSTADEYRIFALVTDWISAGELQKLKKFNTIMKK